MGKNDASELDLVCWALPGPEQTLHHPINLNQSDPEFLTMDSANPAETRDGNPRDRHCFAMLSGQVMQQDCCCASQMLSLKMLRWRLSEGIWVRSLDSDVWLITRQCTIADHGRRKLILKYMCMQPPPNKFAFIQVMGPLGGGRRVSGHCLKDAANQAADCYRILNACMPKRQNASSGGWTRAIQVQCL